LPSVYRTQSVWPTKCVGTARPAFPSVLPSGRRPPGPVLEFSSGPHPRTAYDPEYVRRPLRKFPTSTPRERTTSLPAHHSPVTLLLSSYRYKIRSTPPMHAPIDAVGFPCVCGTPEETEAREPGTSRWSSGQSTSIR